MAKKNKWAKVVIIKNVFDLDQLENDPKAIFSASREAGRAAAFLTAQAKSVPALAEAA